MYDTKNIVVFVLFIQSIKTCKYYFLYGNYSILFWCFSKYIYIFQGFSVFYFYTVYSIFICITYNPLRFAINTFKLYKCLFGVLY